jgi:hypothetical protein
VSAIWFLGPAGDMRSLICPEVDLDMSVERYGGVFQGLSGARSMTTTGLKQKFDLGIKYLDQDEYKWLEALHFRTFPGPYRLLNPFKKNLLSPNASLVKTLGDNLTVQFTMGVSTPVVDWPSAAGAYANTATKWTNRSSGTGVFRLDNRFRVPVTAGSPWVASVYMKGSVALSGSWVIDWHDSTGAQISGSTTQVVSITTAWQRFSVTGTAPAGAVTAKPAFLTSATSPDVYFAAGQFEAGSTATSWELGGGAPVVLLDQLPTTSPRFPLRNVTLSLLEA